MTFDVNLGLTTEQMLTIPNIFVDFRIDDEEQRARINAGQKKEFILRLRNGEITEEVNNAARLKLFFYGL